jgi:hypothetical protein
MDLLLAVAPPLEEAVRRASERLQEAYSPPWQGGAFLFGLTWGVWVLLNFWIWSKTKALGNLLMLIGSGALCLTFILLSFNSGPSGFWFTNLSFLTVSAGFFLSVRPLVEAHIAAIKAKIQAATAGKKDGGAPPPPA